MKNWVIGIGVIALVLGGLFLMGYIDVPVEGFDGDLKITFYDADGNEVSLPMAFMRGGADVSTFSIRITWTYTGTDLQDDTLTVDGTLKVNQLDPVTKAVIHERATESWTGVYIGYQEWTAVSLQLLLGHTVADYGDVGWLLQVTTTLHGTIYDDYDNKLEDTVDLASAEFLIEWRPDIGTFSIGGSVIV
jgi:hypothetical protein